MVHPAYYFRSHVAGSSTCLFGVALLLLPGHSEIGNSEVAVLLEDQVLGFEVAVDGPFGVDVLEAEDDAAGHEFWVRGGVLACYSVKNS